MIGPDDTALAGSARVSILFTVSLISFVGSSILEYSLPLYFSALADFPKGMWASLVVWQFAPWCLVPILAGTIAQRYGERRVWAVSLLGQAVVPLGLVALPFPWIVPVVAFLGGVASAAAWVSGISLVQIVPRHRKGLANGLLMMSLGLGSIVGPLVGRGLLWRKQVSALAATGDWRGIGAFLVNLTKPEEDPPLDNFRLILVGLAALIVLAAVLMWRFGQRRGRRAGGEVQSMRLQSVAGLRQLSSNPRFWALAIGLGLLGGPVFQSANQYLRYRAEDVGLIAGAQDHGWILLELLRPIIWVPAGLAVGLVAGRRAPAILAVAILSGFALAGIGISLAHTPAALFIAVAAFEFMRQFMRWSEGGYLSEHMPEHLRAPAIGWAISIGGFGASAFGFIANGLMKPDATGFDSTRPFLWAARLGLSGAAALLIFDRIVPIRQAPAALPKP